MSRLEDKLKELGYEYNKVVDVYSKDRIRIYIHNNRILKNDCHIAIKNVIIQNRNDIQELKDSIDYYNEQLMTMYKDLEVLKEYE